MRLRLSSTALSMSPCMSLGDKSAMDIKSFISRFLEWD
jgi:hypothetical protein